MLRARDAMDRRYAEPLDVPTLARTAHLSVSHFGRVFKDVYGETPHRYLQRRRLERAMTLLRQTDRRITDIALDVGFVSLGTFSRTFSSVVGCSPTDFRLAHAPIAVPSCFIAAWTRPRESA
jgi:AraC-like DNA-binding protein